MKKQIQQKVKVKHVTISEAIKKVWEKKAFDKPISPFDLCVQVNRILAINAMDGTILRELRRLRQNNICCYTVSTDSKRRYFYIKKQCDVSNKS